jgi:hypothetical protein
MSNKHWQARLLMPSGGTVVEVGKILSNVACVTERFDQLNTETAYLNRRRGGT